MGDGERLTSPRSTSVDRDFQRLSESIEGGAACHARVPVSRTLPSRVCA
jgi:hypothetical protein